MVLVTSVLQVIRPAQDRAPLVAQTFDGGTSVLAGINSSLSLCRVLIPMTPLIQSLVRLIGESSGESVAARIRGDCAVVALMCVLMAGLVDGVPAVQTLQDLHRLMFFNGLCFIVRGSTSGGGDDECWGVLPMEALYQGYSRRLPSRVGSWPIPCLFRTTW